MRKAKTEEILCVFPSILTQRKRKSASRNRVRIIYFRLSKVKDMDCLFCKIIAGDIPSNKVYEDDLVYAFRDIAPEAPVHILIVPKEHIASANEINEGNFQVVGHIFKVASEIAKNEGIADGGYRIVNNCGEDGGQTVKHLHFHLLGGRSLQWPPG